MEIRKRFSNNVAILYISGKIDVNSAAIIEVTGSFIKEGIKKILCNFSNVEALDYNGLSVLAIAYKNAANQEGMLKFCNVPRSIKALFKASRLDLTFSIYRDEESALKSFDLSDKADKLRLRRRFERADIQTTLKYKVGLSANTKLLKGKILNISGEGLFVFTKNTYPTSAELYMELTLADAKRPLILTGTVIWLADKEIQPHSYPGMGIRFSGLDERTQTKIINFIDKNITTRSKS